ncbi:RagB/SusD domain protein [Petrimonas sp. IBARAKI]|nr:RagB/SusD domain protein [Petrimonas sp. IBARAKI]
MKKNNSITILLSLILFSFLSCDNLLNLEPTSNITTASFWKTEDDAKGAIYGMYARFRNVTNSNLFLWGEARSQNLKQSVGNDFSNMRIFQNTLDAVDAGPSWSTLYQVVNDANLILKYVPEISFLDGNNKNQILAEAYSMRAFCYFVMARTWGGVIIFTEPTEGYIPEKMYKERSSIEDCFKLIKDDIDKAISLYPDNNFITGRNRWSKPATNALKGDVYLWTGKVMNGGNSDFSTALNALTEIESSDVMLLSEFNRVFDYDNKGNKEILFASRFQLYESSNTGYYRMYIDQLPPNPAPGASEVIGVPRDGNYWTLSDESLAMFSNEDQRKDGTFYELYSFDAATGLYSKFYGCIQMKFNGVVDAGSRYFLDDVIIYRYADVLLMKAEAENALGKDPSTSINKIRQRAYGENYSKHVFVNGSKAQNDMEILNERLLELFYEGKRWWDLIRFDKVFELVPYFKENPQDKYRLLWPIGLNILSMEPNISQNPGYQER